VNTEFRQNEIVALMRDVTVTFDGYATRALSRVDLQIRRGELLGVLGAKGAGKSTLLKVFAGRLKPNEGAVKVFGRSPRWGTTRARIGYLPETSDSGPSQGFLSRLLARHGSGARSGRPSLAHAILGNRDLFVLDEPLAGLAHEKKTDAANLIQELMGRGKTVVLSSDSLMDIKDLCQRFAVIDEGRIQAVGTLGELLAMERAIRFLPPVLPWAVVDRVLKVLREEILGESSLSEIDAPDAKVPLEKSTGNPSVDRHLKELTKAPEPGQAASTASPQSDSIDHEKLEELTRPPKNE
jgi:ABC-type multidrug transport system ATPase subunit